MHILLIYGEGRMSEGLLLSSARGRMRVMLPGLADAVEFREMDGAWMTESGASVEIAAVMTAGGSLQSEDMRPTVRRRPGLATGHAGYARAN